jgi:uncharacterized membrane protein
MRWVTRRFRARRRLLFSAAVGVGLYLFLPERFSATTRLAVSWDGAAIGYLALVLSMAVGARPAQMRRRAAEEDTSVAVNLLVAVLAASASLLAVTTVLRATSGLPETTRVLNLVLAGATTLLSWLMVHTLFAVHYAHGYYAPDAANPGEVRAGIQFPSEDAPDYFDFLYYSFVIGMTAQTSDVAITTREMRRTALLQGIVSFVFNTVVLAFAVNIAAGLI